MNMQSKAVLAITFVVVMFSQVQAQEKNRDRPGPPAFSSIDINGDGGIDMDEFSQQTLPNGDHQTIFSHIDSDNNGVISSTEFKNHRPPTKQQR
jgi:Ca2+-binding EF-hand superfamily protein